MSPRHALLVAASLSLSCTRPAEPPPTSEAWSSAPVVGRVPAIKATDPRYDDYEGVGAKNACASDAECHSSSCGNMLCSAESIVGDVCRVDDRAPDGAGCGCVFGECIWWK